jgi:hypothetical protein
MYPVVTVDATGTRAVAVTTDSFVSEIRPEVQLPLECSSVVVIWKAEAAETARKPDGQVKTTSRVSPAEKWRIVWNRSVVDAWIRREADKASERRIESDTRS